MLAKRYQKQKSKEVNDARKGLGDIIEQVDEMFTVELPSIVLPNVNTAWWHVEFRTGRALKSLLHRPVHAFSSLHKADDIVCCMIAQENERKGSTPIKKHLIVNGNAPGNKINITA